MLGLIRSLKDWSFSRFWSELNREILHMLSSMMQMCGRFTLVPSSM